MKKRTLIVMSSLSREELVEAAVLSKWWKELTNKAKKDYIKKHPNSKYGKFYRKNIKDPIKKGISKTKKSIKQAAKKVSNPKNRKKVLAAGAAILGTAAGVAALRHYGISSKQALLYLGKNAKEISKQASALSKQGYSKAKAGAIAIFKALSSAGKSFGTYTTGKAIYNESKNLINDVNNKELAEKAIEFQNKVSIPEGKVAVQSRLDNKGRGGNTVRFIPKKEAKQLLNTRGYTHSKSKDDQLKIMNETGVLVQHIQ